MLMYISLELPDQFRIPLEIPQAANRAANPAPMTRLDIVTRIIISKP